MQKKKIIFWSMVATLIFVRLVTTVPYFDADARYLDIPERPDGVPTEVPPVVEEVLPGVVEDENNEDGAIIVLDASSQPTDELWTQMEWYAPGTGEWHVVEGWAGQFTDGKVQWWVGEDELGNGPFRWVVYTQKVDGEMIKMSEEFNLPSSKNKKTTVNLTWP
ncbi:MAG: hypothetical protein AAF633_14550 [Chloroflexota bacterium]